MFKHAYQDTIKAKQTLIFSKNCSDKWPVKILGLVICYKWFYSFCLCGLHLGTKTLGYISSLQIEKEPLANFFNIICKITFACFIPLTVKLCGMITQQLITMQVNGQTGLQQRIEGRLKEGQRKRKGITILGTNYSRPELVSATAATVPSRKKKC